MSSKEHWEKVYVMKSAESVSWFQEHASTSLQLIAETQVPQEGSIIDVGGGVSTLVDDLLAQGYGNVTVLDLSATALQAARTRLGDKENRVSWLVGDITDIQLPKLHFDVWHDRAVFHFLVSPAARAAYKAVLHGSLKSNGHLILATFAEDGPPQCSGLPVMRYSVEELVVEMREAFDLVRAVKEDHSTPSGNIQKFSYCHFRKVER